MKINNYLHFMKIKLELYNMNMDFKLHKFKMNAKF